MANEQAGYFIHDWQEVRGPVRELSDLGPTHL